MELELVRKYFYRVKQGQTLESIAKTFGYPPRYLAACNHLTGDVEEGQILLLPKERRNLYTLCGGESKSLLCGSIENFESRNRTKNFYIGQTVFL